MNLIRKFHLYLGCFFTPLLLFFVVSGAWQTFSLHKSKKDGSYVAPLILKQLSEIHENQRLPMQENQPTPSVPFRLFVLFMSLGFVATASLGIIMAFKFTRNAKTIWISLISGALIPILLIWLSV
jgi:hypothetical protein